FLSRPALATFPLSLHDALPISSDEAERQIDCGAVPIVDDLAATGCERHRIDRAPGIAGQTNDPGPDNPRYFGDVRSQRHIVPLRDRKSTRLNSSHVKISYAVFC